MTQTHHDDAPLTHHDVFEAFLASTREIPITLLGKEGGKHSPAKTTRTITTLGKAPQPFMQIIDNSVRHAFAQAPLNAISTLTMSRLATDAYEHIQDTLLDLSDGSGELTSAQARKLCQAIAEDFRAPDGFCFQELSHMAGFYADAYDPIDLGLVSFPEQYDEALLHYHQGDDTHPEAMSGGRRGDEAESDGSLSFMEFIAEHPMTLHPYIETRTRLNNVLKRAYEESQALFNPSHTGFATSDDTCDPVWVQQKLDVLQHFHDRLIADAKHQILHSRDALYRQSLDLSPSARTALLLEAIAIARDPSLPPETLEASLAPNSDLMQQLHGDALANATPDDAIQLPATHLKTIAGAKIGDEVHILH